MTPLSAKLRANLGPLIVGDSGDFGWCVAPTSARDPNEQEEFCDAIVATVNSLPALADLIEAAEAMADAIENPKCLGCGAFNEPCACAGSQRRAATNKYRAARARLDEVMK